MTDDRAPFREARECARDAKATMDGLRAAYAKAEEAGPKPPDDREAFRVNRDAGLKARHEQRLAHAQEQFVVIAYKCVGGMNVYGPYGRDEAGEHSDRLMADPEISGAYRIPLETP